ncbi:MAG: haloalkane dehalogenase [Leptolyngbyaceae cyanobacterium MO_188.B28]|nr:haloalkane dehalogenase [Leptolyngbyaceae cyanobacterium MO_188.B28]
MKKLFFFVVLGLLLSPTVSSSSVQADDSCSADLEVLTTSDGVEFVRTPDDCFEDLPGWPYKTQYVEIDGLRQAYFDVGRADADPILLLHGQPSWSYLYRFMIPVLAASGHRVIAMDHIGMGRSDKPIDLEYYTYLGHVSRLEAFIQALDLDHITLFGQDWGGVMGLQVVGTHPDWFDRFVIGHAALPIFEAGTIPFPLPQDIEASNARVSRFFAAIPERQPPFYDKEGNLLFQGFNSDEGFGALIAHALYYEDYRASEIVEALTYFALTQKEEAAYDAPFPSRIAMAGPRTFPSLVNMMPGVTQVAWEGLSTFEKPFLTIWGDNDPVPLVGPPEIQQALITAIPGAAGQDHVRLRLASHFLQDDRGVAIARRINAFISDTSVISEPDEEMSD